MALDRLELRDFRCFQAASFLPHSDTNLIVGENGSGKTTLLEAIHVLGTGRSFRVRELGPLIRRSATGFELTAQTMQPRQTVEARSASSGLELRVNGQSLRGSADLSAILPVQALHPEMHALIEGPPEGRRRFLDWGAFHVKRVYLDVWRRYHRALRQRNAALKENPSRRDLDAWDVEVIRTGSQLDAYRLEYVAQLAAAFAKVAARLLPGGVGLRYHRGWAAEDSLEHALRATADRERLLKTTQVGPHRADLEICFDGAPARHAASRGQQKLLAVSLGLGQARIIAEAAQRGLILLLDDPVAELDHDRAERLAEEVACVPAQRFITGLTADGYPTRGSRVFHVKQGELVQVL
jgi:DNA replication and repair protein RecF